MAIPFVYVRASGSYREIGRQIGEAAHDQIHASVAFFRDNFEAMTEGRMTYAAAQREAQGYLAAAERHVPDLVEELRGVAEGSGVAFDDLLIPNCGEEFTANETAGGGHRMLAPGSPRRGDRCTAVAVSAGGRHVLGHNMDWYVVDAANNVLFDMDLPGGSRLMGIAGAPYLLMIAMTSNGVGNVSNSVHSNDNRIGVPNAFVRRLSLEGATLEDARTRGLLEARARGTNHFFADTGGRLWDIETSATASAFMDHTATGFMAHTNHYVSPDMSPFEGSDFNESHTRLATAERMLAEGVAAGADPVDLVARVLRCHEPGPEACICGHPDESEPPADQGMTVGSMICDLDERRVYACAGPPCENEYVVFEMD
jgi:isopenicillin-N N-acyltransferase like protein